MLLASVDFGPVAETAPGIAHQEDAIWTYLAGLDKNGQTIGGSFSFCQRDGRYYGCAELSRRGAAERSNSSRWGRSHLDELATQFGQEPVWTVLADAPQEHEEATLGDAKALVVSTNALDMGSPIRRRRDRRAVARYVLPVTDEEREWLGAWASTYRAHDRVWLHSGSLESAAYRELADPNSGLSAEGRDLGRAVEAATGLPTYYFLVRYWGRENESADRPCPGCGKAWFAGPSPDYGYAFCCDACRLVSDLPTTTEDARRARIGEWRP